MEICYAVEWTSQGHYAWFYLEAGRTAMLEIRTLAGCGMHSLLRGGVQLRTIGRTAASTSSLILCLEFHTVMCRSSAVEAPFGFRLPLPPSVSPSFWSYASPMSIGFTLVNLSIKSGHENSRLQALGPSFHFELSAPKSSLV